LCGAGIVGVARQQQSSSSSLQTISISFTASSGVAAVDKSSNII